MIKTETTLLKSIVKILDYIDRRLGTLGVEYENKRKPFKIRIAINLYERILTRFSRSYLKLLCYATGRNQVTFLGTFRTLLGSIIMGWPLGFIADRLSK